MNILIVDDSAYIASSLKKLLMLNPNILNIRISESVDQAIREIKLFPPDVLILDIHFPEGSGFDVLLKARELSKVMKILILTNFACKELSQKSYKYGADFFFDKSNEFEQLVEVINKLSIEFNN